MCPAILNLRSNTASDSLLELVLAKGLWYALVDLCIGKSVFRPTIGF